MSDTDNDDIKAIQKITQQLDGLDDEPRERVLRYIADREGFTIEPKGQVIKGLADGETTPIQSGSGLVATRGNGDVIGAPR